MSQANLVYGLGRKYITMNYNLYIYGTKAFKNNALFIHIAKRNITKKIAREESDSLITFDIIKVIKLIESMVGNSCNVITKKYTQKSGEIDYLHIITDYKKVKEVLPRLLAIAEENRLVLYDAEINKTYFKDIVNESFVKLKIRDEQIKKLIEKKLVPIYKIRQLVNCHGFYRDICSEYVVIINKKRGVSFEERIIDFYNCLKNNLQENEKLLLVDKCFNLCGEDYVLSYCIEGYGANSDKLGYMEENYPRIEDLNRMSVEEGFVWLSKVTHTNEAGILEAMNFPDFLRKYPNQAERFIEVIKFSERLHKQPFDIGISSLNNNYCEVMVTIEDTDNDRESIFDNQYYSTLRLGDDSLDLLAPIISEYYPYFFDRYYSFTNPIVPQAWLKIVNRVKELKEIIKNDILSTKLKEYVDKLKVHHFCFKDASDDEWLEPLDLIKKYRNNIIEMFSIFIEWSEPYLVDYNDMYGDRVFNIVGP